jgi:CheY-like chemotaxis protein
LFRGIIISRGGTVGVVSPRAGGTEFVVRLPAARDQAVVPAAREVARSGDGVTRVLVIEDDAAVRDEVVAMLAADRLHVEVAADSKTAMDKLEDPSFDVVVTDVSMPLLDVYDLYRTFREHPQLRRRIVFVSGHPLDRDARDFVAATGVAVLTRPFDAERLRRAVAERRKA